MDPKLKSARITSAMIVGALLVGLLISNVLFGNREKVNAQGGALSIKAGGGGAAKVSYLPDMKDWPKVPGNTWVTVKNPNGVVTGNNKHEFNDNCLIEEGGALKQVGVDGDKILAEYTGVRGQGYGTVCGTGTIFFVSKEEFSTMTERYNAILRERQQEKDKIQRLLDKK